MNQLVDIPGAGFGSRIAELNAGWRNALVGALGLDRETFQLIQGTFGLPFDETVTFYAFSDQIPSNSSVHFCDAVMRGRWSESYFRLLTALLPETETGLRGLLDAEYSHWIAYRNAGISSKSMAALFTEWSEAYLCGSRQATARRLFNESLADAVSQAYQRYFDESERFIAVTPRGAIATFPKYSATVEAAKNCLFWGRSSEIAFDSAAMDPSVRSRLFQGAESRFQRIFSGTSLGAFDPLEQRASLGRFTITGRIGAHGWLPTSPGNWYDAQIVARAMAAERGDSTWDKASSAGGWNTFFSPRGCMFRRRTDLLLVSDYRLTVRSHAIYSEAEVSRLRGFCRGGVWPFFSHTGQGRVTSDLQHNRDGSLSVTLSQPASSFQVWGAKVQSLAP